MRAIFVIGQKASGKSYLADRLRAKTGLPSIDIDQELLIHYPKIRHISQLYQKIGAQEFRRREFEILQKLVNEPVLVSCGAGAITYSSSFKLLLKHLYVLFLDTPIDVCIDRIKRSAKAYLGCNDPIEWQKIMASRQPDYLRAAKATVSNLDEALTIINVWLKGSLTSESR